MKAIKHGKKYDTSTAKRLGEWESEIDAGSFTYCEETLYQKRTGEFFLACFGGPMTKYARSLGGNSWSSGEIIIPLAYNAAREWAEAKLSADKFESIFGEVEEDESRMTFTLSISVTAVETAKREAAKKGINVSAYIEQLIMANL